MPPVYLRQKKLEQVTSPSLSLSRILHTNLSPVIESHQQVTLNVLCPLGRVEIMTVVSTFFLGRRHHSQVYLSDRRSGVTGVVERPPPPSPPELQQINLCH